VAIERKIGYTLPEDYREYLRDFGGSHFIYGANSTLTKHGLGVWACSYGILPNMPDDFMKAYHCYHPEVWTWKHHRMLPGVIPIGDVGDGDQICLVLTGRRRGAVFYWVADEEGDRPTLKNMRWLAPSFTALMDSLVTDAERQVFGYAKMPPQLPMEEDNLSSAQKRAFVKNALDFFWTYPELIDQAGFDPDKNVPALEDLYDKAEAYAVANAAAIAELIREQGRENISALTLEGNKTEVDILYHITRRLLYAVLQVAPFDDPVISKMRDLL
jgi:hypothetical protein